MNSMEKMLTTEVWSGNKDCLTGGETRQRRTIGPIYGCVEIGPLGAWSGSRTGRYWRVFDWFLVKKNIFCYFFYCTSNVVSCYICVFVLFLSFLFLIILSLYSIFSYKVNEMIETVVFVETGCFTLQLSLRQALVV